jgi:signal transduction histidine kinase
MTPMPQHLQARLGAFIAEEVMSSVRHSVVNDLTALAALCYRLKIEHLVRIDDQGAARSAHDLLDNIQAYVGTASRRLALSFVPEPAAAPPALDARATVAATATRMPAPPGVSVDVAGGDPLALHIDEPDLELAVACLLANAYDAIADTGGQLRVRCEPDGPQNIRIDVEQDGAPMKDKVRARIFEPFFSTKPGHLGVGLNVARRIAGRWGGTLELATDSPRGVVSTLSLPVTPPRTSSSNH